ncbi:hypothetical protein ADL35_19640, partial [Streptomyces sp. NRRL WC-3753]
AGVRILLPPVLSQSARTGSYQHCSSEASEESLGSDKVVRDFISPPVDLVEQRNDPALLLKRRQRQRQRAQSFASDTRLRHMIISELSELTRRPAGMQVSSQILGRDLLMI